VAVHVLVGPPDVRGVICAAATVAARSNPGTDVLCPRRNDVEGG
jgi:hypothetical protein